MSRFAHDRRTFLAAASALAAAGLIQDRLFAEEAGADPKKLASIVD